jgi:hypothetical protein
MWPDRPTHRTIGLDEHLKKRRHRCVFVERRDEEATAGSLTIRGVKQRGCCGSSTGAGSPSCVIGRTFPTT